MATRTFFENSNEIGVFAALTNAYCLTGEFIGIVIS
jgi:translation initiation factor 6